MSPRLSVRAVGSGDHFPRASGISALFPFQFARKHIEWIDFIRLRLARDRGIWWYPPGGCHEIRPSTDRAFLRKGRDASERWSKRNSGRGADAGTSRKQANQIAG